MNYLTRLPKDVIQDEVLSDYWSLRDKQNFQIAKAKTTAGLRCLPTVDTYSTIPRKKYGEDNDMCPLYTEKNAETGCCTIDMTRDVSGRRFMYALAQAINRCDNIDFARTIFDQDIVAYVRNRMRRVRFVDDPVENTAPLEIETQETWFDVLMQFLFRSKPRFDIFAVTGYDRFNHPVRQKLYDQATAKWYVGELDARILALMRSTGVDGCVVFQPSTNLLVHTAPFYMRCACLEHGGAGYVDITNVAQVFASPSSGFGGRKDLLFRGVGVLSNRTTFYEVVLSILRSMPAMHCRFEMAVDDGNSSAPGTHPLDTGFTRVLPIYVAFSHTNVLHPGTQKPYIDDVMEEMYDRLQTDLKTGHAPKYSAASGGQPFGEYTETLYPSRVSKHGYTLKFDLFTRGGAGHNNFFAITKTML